MVVPLSPNFTETWWSKDHSVSVEYGPSVLEEIRNRAVAGLNAFRHGGLEIGGVLYGVRETGKVRPLTYPVRR